MYLHTFAFMLIISVYLRIKTKDTAISVFTDAWLYDIIKYWCDDKIPGMTSQYK